MFECLQNPQTKNVGPLKQYAKMQLTKDYQTSYLFVSTKGNHQNLKFWTLCVQSVLCTDNKNVCQMCTVNSQI